MDTATDARPVTSPGTRRPRKRGYSRYLYVAPAIAYIAIFAVAPMVRGLWLSFTETKLIRPTSGEFVGVDNYLGLLGSDGFWNSLLTTLVYTGATVVIALVLGTSAALALNRGFKGRTVIRAVLAFPYATPTIAAVLVFIWIFNPSSGVLNRGLGVLGIGEIGWLTDPAYGMVSVLLATGWKVFPLVMLVVLAALQSVPEELEEATRIDGADVLSSFRAVVLPHILPTLRIVALLMTVWSIRRFEIIYLLTGGGPVETTNTIVVSIYRTAFSREDLGQAAALGMLGLVLSIVVTVVFLLVERRETRKENGA